MFFNQLGYLVGGAGGGGLPRDWYTTCSMQFFTPASSKIEVFETYFFDIVIT